MKNFKQFFNTYSYLSIELTYYRADRMAEWNMLPL